MSSIFGFLPKVGTYVLLSTFYVEPEKINPLTISPSLKSKEEKHKNGLRSKQLQDLESMTTNYIYVQYV